MMLNRHYFRLEKRLLSIEKELDSLSVKPSLSPQENLALEKMLIQLQIEWEHFVRRLILDSATGKASNSTGVVYSTLSAPPKNREQALHRLLSTYPNNNRGHEPEWSHSNKAIDAATRLQLTNLPDISGLLGVTPWPLDEMRHLRNFIAHQSKNSASVLRRKNMTSLSGKIFIPKIAFEHLSSGTKRYRRWTSFMITIARQLV
ncbi:hypothetical protein [Pseudomonas sp. p99-361]|uniref:hypothetical protein n=1 Tax=Pseudomonas sp. p99-361 TaxID=2479852 RepID=UPI0013154189|nr:hypothetical protein [Pseudomonas sp. p99-361]